MAIIHASQPEASQRKIAPMPEIYQGVRSIRNAFLSARHNSRLGVLSFFLFLLVPLQAMSQDFALHDGDTVVFYGDSITAQRLFTKFVEDFVLTRYPSMHVRFINAGVPGDTVYGGYAGTMADRVKRDVEPYHPAMITVMLGMNDGGYVPFDARIDGIFRTGYVSLMDALRRAAPDAALTLIRPSPYEESTHGTDFPGYSRVIERNAQFVSQEADQLHATLKERVFLADFYQPIVDAVERANHLSSEFAPLIVPDHIHPGDVGHWIMAAELMSRWHVNPVVSRVVLNADKSSIVTAENTKVESLQRKEDGLRWIQTDQALPLPLDSSDPLTKFLLSISDIAKLDQQIVQVDSLPAGNYELAIDEKTIGVFSQDQLNRGVNIALYATPMLGQARDIEWHEQRRATLDQARFILSAEITATDGSRVAADTLERAEAELASNIRSTLILKPHTFELRKTTTHSN
ncbi:MAG TPA: SGNH/GDSL hydrolase family protein [Terriglobales bacterium]|nr:SGNH/GDSL hydrolase family protein [Terriglobales bacterium]